MSDDDRPRRHQRLRPHRPQLLPGRQGSRAPTSTSWPSTTSARSRRWPTCSSTTRCSACCPTRSRSPTTASRRRRRAQGARRCATRRSCPWGDLGVDVVDRVDRLLHRPRARPPPTSTAGAPLVIISAPCDGRRRHVRRAASTTTRSTRPSTRSSRTLVHDELLRADGQGARRRLRRREGPDDHRPRLHRRPEARRRPAQATCAGPAPRRSTSSRPRPARPGPPASCSSR